MSRGNLIFIKIKINIVSTYVFIIEYLILTRGFYIILKMLEQIRSLELFKMRILQRILQLIRILLIS